MLSHGTSELSRILLFKGGGNLGRSVRYLMSTAIGIPLFFIIEPHQESSHIKVAEVDWEMLENIFIL